MSNFLVSERFYSIQGEAKTTGFPSYFIRLANCNLNCGSTIKELNEIRKNPENYKGGDFQGELHKNGKATWTCDTLGVWVKGKETPFQNIINDWELEKIYEDIKSGLINVIFTGGEPCLPKHQEAIEGFINYFFQYSLDKTYREGFKNNHVPFYEIETNGTVYIKSELFTLLHQINCSPKLSNSGNDPRLRYNEKALRRIMEHPNYQFKFVISKEEDLKEIFDEYINKLNIPLRNVICMPGLDNQEDFFERTQFVMEMSKKYRFIAGSRMHIAAWSKLTGV